MLNVSVVDENMFCLTASIWLIKYKNQSSVRKKPAKQTDNKSVDYYFVSTLIQYSVVCGTKILTVLLLLFLKMLINDP